jgi:hypothetical protein
MVNAPSLAARDALAGSVGVKSKRTRTGSFRQLLWPAGALEIAVILAVPRVSV